MNKNTSSTLSPVPFHGDTIFCTTINDQPYTAVKPIVENMGLDWTGQIKKLNANRERWGMVTISIPSQGGKQHAACMPVRKLPTYLNTINPNKVKPELREKIIRYQEESDEVLWRYWLSNRDQEGKQAQKALPPPSESVETQTPASVVPAIQRPDVHHIESSIDDILIDVLRKLREANVLAAFTVNEGNCPIKGLRQSLYLSLRNNINSAVANVRAMAAAEDVRIPPLLLR